MKKSVFLLVGLFLLPGRAWGGGVPAASLTRVEFLALDEPGRQVIRQEGPRLSVSGGADFPRMAALDGYVDWINATWGGSVDKIGRANTLLVRLEFPLAKNLAWGVAGEHLWARAGGTVLLPGPPHRLRVDLSVTGGELYLRRQWPFRDGRLAVSCLLGLGCYRSEYRERENGYDVSGDTTRAGARVALAGTWYFSPRAGLFVEAGYRRLEFDRYRGGGGVVTFVSPGTPPAEADFSGATIVGGAFFDF